MVEHGDGLRAFGRDVTGSESGLDGCDGLIICNRIENKLN